jgi:hypothetical protein
MTRSCRAGKHDYLLWTRTAGSRAVVMPPCRDGVEEAPACVLLEVLLEGIR